MSNGIQRPGTGILTRKYKSGSIIYFEGDKSEYIYILKEGKVMLTSNKVEKGEIVETKEVVKPGEFFGVKSSLGKYPRDETAQTMGNVDVLVLKPADFEILVLKNLAVVKKMLRVFSNQLRRIGRMVREVLGDSGTINPEEELFKIGEFYYKAGRFQQALYAYKRYMEYYPDTKYAGHAMKRINAINSGSAETERGPDFLETSSAAPRPVAALEDDDLSDFSIDNGSAHAADDDDLVDFESDSTPVKQEQHSPLTSEMDDFLSDSNDLDDAGFDDPFADTPPARQVSVADNFTEAMSQYADGDFPSAHALYEKVIAASSFRDDTEKTYHERAHFEIGRCLLKMGKYPEALTAFSDMIKKFPKSNQMRNSLLHMGLVYEMSKNNAKALAYYKKVAEAEPKDDVARQAMKRMGMLQGK